MSIFQKFISEPSSLHYLFGKSFIYKGELFSRAYFLLACKVHNNLEIPYIYYIYSLHISWYKFFLLCISCLKIPILYYSNLEEKQVADDKTFWKTIKLFLSDKIVSREKLTLVEKDEIDINTAQILNIFISNIVNNLEIAEYANSDLISDNMNDPVT